MRQQFSVRETGVMPSRWRGGCSVKGSASKVPVARWAGVLSGATGTGPGSFSRRPEHHEQVCLRLSTPILVRLQCKSSLYIRPAIYPSVPSRSVLSYSMQNGFFIGERMGRRTAGGSVGVSAAVAGGEKPLLLADVSDDQPASHPLPQAAFRLASSLRQSRPAQALENGLKLGQECRMIYIGCSSQALARAAWS